MQFQKLRGMQDTFGDEALCVERIERAARCVFKRFGFKPLRTPILEDKKLFTRALGDETDVVQKEMYEFLDRSKTEVAIRPEGTASVVRAYLENHFDKNEGLSKFYYMGPMFRSERPQAGRLRQFHQIGVEQLGTDSPYADAETIHCLAAFLDECGIAGYRVRLNNLGTLEERKVFKEKLKGFFTPNKQHLCEDCRNRLDKNVFRILDCKNESCRKIVKQSPRIDGFLTSESKGHFEKVTSLLESSGVHLERDFYMVRGLDYYTKTVFEVSHEALGAQDALGAGGRYDRLIELFGGPRVGAVGFAVGVERLVMCLVAGKTTDETAYKDCYFLATLGQNAADQGFQILSSLRKSGIRALMEFDAKSLKSQLRAADKEKCRYVIILGDDELNKGVCVLKDMQDGSQKELKLDDVKNAHLR